MRTPSIVERLIALFVGALALVHGYQVVLGLSAGHDPRSLMVEHLVVFLTGIIAAYGIWRGRSWAAWALALHGLTTALLIVSLGPILGLDPASRSGLWVGAASIALFVGIGTWYIHRQANRPSASA